MTCADFEDRMLDYDGLMPSARAEVDAHVAACSSCREYIEVLRRIDVALVRAYSAVGLPEQLRESIRRRTQAHDRRALPSALPELFDFVGVGAVIAIIGGLLWNIVPAPQVRAIVAESKTLAIGLAMLALVAAILVSLKGHAELES